ncbi:hypothetical protein [Aliikangiella coralliicola]|uniref:Uncharacterized protein n=1 Tax=Aliikangiella coralliicola TaxID=2592383 RepID=A0A545UJ08_9GAMM|nr:hypothetical protein [Aliikangiella coralliicola]TQV89452.1 hypothetical protein FLL46_00805 [Aliikangiella coralliicola]
MKKLDRENIIETSWEIHAQVESHYLSLSAKKGDEEWLEKQRVLLADMALHLLQTALNPEEIELDKLRNNINSILVICDQFLPEAKLKESADKLF